MDKNKSRNFLSTDRSDCGPVGDGNGEAALLVLLIVLPSDLGWLGVETCSQWSIEVSHLLCLPEYG